MIDPSFFPSLYARMKFKIVLIIFFISIVKSETQSNVEKNETVSCGIAWPKDMSESFLPYGNIFEIPIITAYKYCTYK